MNNYEKFLKKTSIQGFIGHSSELDYEKITEEQKRIMKHYIDLNFLEDLLELIKAILLDIKKKG